MYNKLFTKILDSSIWLEPDQHRLVWITLIAAMDRYGVTQFACAENLASRARVSLEACESAIAAFESPDPHDQTQEFEGRRIERIPGGWLVLNAEKYREMVTASVASEKSRERMRKFREKNRAALGYAELRTVTPSEADAASEANASTEREKRPALSGSKRLPEDFDLTPERRQVAQSFSLEPASTFAKFKDHYIGTGDERANWEAVWRNWCRREISPKSSGPDKSRGVVREAVTRARIGDLLK